MRFRLKLFATSFPAILPLNYQYPLSAVIYKILQQSDKEYAYFLHERGYRQPGSLKSFKLFAFSDIKTPFKIKGDRMCMLAPEAEVMVSFHLPQAAEAFIKGLFLNQEIELADRISKTKFRINQVESLPPGLSKQPIQEIVLQPLSPIVSGKPNNDNGYYDFLAPEHPEFIPQLMYNWRSKYNTLYEDAEEAFADAGMQVLFYKNPSKARLITIKAGTTEETKIKGYINFQLKVLGRLEALELLMNSGVGVYNSQGMGCVGLNE